MASAFSLMDSVWGVPDTLVDWPGRENLRKSDLDKLRWRREGTTDEPDDSSDEEGEEGASDIVELQELCQEQANFERYAICRHHSHTVVIAAGPSVAMGPA